MVYDQASYLQISVQRAVPALPLLGQPPRGLCALWPCKAPRCFCFEEKE